MVQFKLTQKVLDLRSSQQC